MSGSGRAWEEANSGSRAATEHEVQCDRAASGYERQRAVHL